MNAFLGYLQLTRPLNLLIAGLSIFMGGLLTGSIHPLLKLALACISGMLIMAGANAINDCYDVEIDRINRPGRPLPAGRVTLHGARIFSFLLFALGTAAGFCIHRVDGCIAFVASVLATLYSALFKKMALLGNIIVSLVTGMAFIYGGLAVGRWEIAAIVGIFAFFFHLGREILKDIQDMEGDAARGAKTFPITRGITAALVLVTLDFALLIGLTWVPFVLGIFSFRYLIIVLAGVDFFLVLVLGIIWVKRDPVTIGKLAFALKIDMFVGLLAVFLGRVS